MRVLSVNPGSSSLKATLLDGEEILSDHEIPLEGSVEAVQTALSDLDLWSHERPPEAIGVRVVHGGRSFGASVVVDSRVIKTLADLIPLAPLHLPVAIRVLSALTGMGHALRVVAVFDTQFHRTLPEAARRYAIPPDWEEKEGIEKYGFHGLSYDDIVHRLPRLMARPLPERLVAVHWGNGASACAISQGRSVDTSMGLTPLDGLVMGSRPGSIDPGIVPLLLRKGYSPEDVEEALNHRSGLFALSGGISDFREIEERRLRGDLRAGLAFEKAVYSVVATVGSYAAVLGGIEALVMTGGVGENSWRARSAVMDRLGFLGVREDLGANRTGSGDRRVSGRDSRVEVWALHAREDRTIARETERLLATRETGSPNPGGQHA